MSIKEYVLAFTPHVRCPHCQRMLACSEDDVRRNRILECECAWWLVASRDMSSQHTQLHSVLPTVPIHAIL